MKINQQIRNVYTSNSERYERLAKEVCEILKPKAEEAGWFFISRTKELKSFALKIETGRVRNPSQPEDFFACTIVVPTIARITDAEGLVLSHFELSERRPKDDAITHKNPSEFVFDDLRLYVTRRENSSGRNNDLVGILFEVQIKTVLQYAWSIATHDLIYKTNTVSWPKERIAFQVKAMLEHAEIAIAEAANLSDSSAIAKQDSRTAHILKIISQLEQFWPVDALPDDRKRLAENILLVLKTVDVDVDSLESILEAEKTRLGILPIDLSPYAFLIQALAQNNSIDFEKKFKRGHIKTSVLIHRGMELPAWMTAGHERIINLDS